MNQPQPESIPQLQARALSASPNPTLSPWEPSCRRGGTAAYAAPERLDGGAGGREADVWVREEISRRVCSARSGSRVCQGNLNSFGGVLIDHINYEMCK